MRKLLATLLTISTVAGTTAAYAGAYNLASGDVLEINVYRQDDMKYRVRVDSKGYVRFPVAGRFKAQGETTEQLENNIAVALRKHGFSQPEVVVSVEKFAPRNVYVLGAVQNAVTMEIPEGGEISALQAISACGGFGEEADIDRVVVRRQMNDKIVTIKVPARRIMNGDTVEDIMLSPRDTVVVPNVKAVAVLGTVKKPGRFFATSEGPLTVSRVIALAGGVERPNSLSEIRVTRDGKNYQVDVRSLIENGKGGEDMSLEPGDIVYVPETRW